MTDSDFLWPCSDYLWKMRVIPVCLGKTLWRPSALLCKLWEIRPGAALMRVRSKRHISWICQSGFLNECDAMCIQYERAVCVDTCSEARMCPDSQPAGVSVEPQSLHLSPSFPCAVKEAFIPPPPQNEFVSTPTPGLISGVVANIHLCLFLFFGTATSTSKVMREKIWGFPYQVSVPGISI